MSDYAFQRNIAFVSTPSTTVYFTAIKHVGVALVSIATGPETPYTSFEGKAPTKRQGSRNGISTGNYSRMSVSVVAIPPVFFRLVALLRSFYCANKGSKRSLTIA